MTARQFITTAILASSFLHLSTAFSADAKDEAWAKKQAFQVAAQYARSISCQTTVDSKNLIVLTPWKNFEDMNERENVKYALIWHGDIGCYGGTGTTNPHITIVRVRTGDTFVVDPLESSPIVKFDVPVHYVEGIVKFSASELLLSAKDWAPDDAHCCPSIPVHILLRREDKGNWNFVEKRRISH
jgi:hypothetical protein